MNDDDEVDEFKPRRNDLVRATHPNIDMPLPADIKDDIGLVVERVAPGEHGNPWAIVAYRVMWSGPGAGLEGKLTLEPAHRLSILY